MESEPGKNESLQGVSFTEPLVRILVVEDNPGDVVIITQLLKSSGFHFDLTHVSTLRESLKCCKDKDFDIILLDLGLPDSVGLETLKKIHASRFKSPVVVMTGLDDEETALASLREGALDYLVKNKLTADYIVRSLKYSIERKKIMDLQKRHMQQFSILSSSSSILNDHDDITLCLKEICENLGSFLENAGVIAFEFPGPSTCRVSGVDWLTPWSEQIRLLMGWDISKTIFSNNGRKKDIQEAFRGDKLNEIKGGIFEIFGGCLDLKNCVLLENILNIKHIYTIGFLHQKNIYGGFVIFSQNEVKKDDVEIIEAISSRTSISINRRLIENDLKLSENRFRKLNKSLERKVKERTKELELANRRLHQELTERILTEEALKKKESLLKELNDTKDKFFNIVAHDLKNPFTSLLGSSELLFQNIHLMDNENIIKLATILNDSAKSGYAILQNLLDWSRSQTGLLQYNPERICLSDLIDENISNLQFLASNKDIRLHSEAAKNILIFTDAQMLNTVLRNLLSNSVKFTCRGGKVVVGTIINADEIIVSVKDTGIGISAENIEKLFRIDTKHSMPGTDNEQGTGLGLKLCKEFVEKLGGKIWVESIENVGSDFRFTIPVHVV